MRHIFVAMNSDIPPPPPIQQRGCRPGGCILGCFGVVVGVPLILTLIGYIVAFHTSAPLKMMAGVLNESGQIELRGVGGSVSSGFTIEEAIFYGDDGNESKIEGLKLKYSGLFRSLRNQEFVIEELSAERSEFIVDDDWFDFSTENEDPPSSSSSGSAAAGDSVDFRLELQKLDIRETRIRTADSSIDVNIPEISLSGLVLENENFELEDFLIDSDHLKISLEDAAPARVEGQFLPFTRKIVGSVQPGIHDLVVSEIDFTVELEALGSSSKSRSIAFDGACKQVDLPNGDRLTEIVDFDTEKYFDAKGNLAMKQLNLVARELGDGSNLVLIEGGGFWLGATEFGIAETEIDTKDATAMVEARAQIGDTEIVATWPNEAPPWNQQIKLSSTPEMTTHDLLALVYYHRAYEELGVEEKERVDTLATVLAKMDRPAEG